MDFNDNDENIKKVWKPLVANVHAQVEVWREWLTDWLSDQQL